MTMQKHFDAPGTAAWHARRAGSYNAGDAPAMLGCSPNKTRTQLLDQLATGIEPEFTDYVQTRVLDRGHLVEEQMRPLAEEIMGEELFVYGGSLPIEGLSRPLGASFDGVTILDDVNWECKSLNAEIRAALPHDGRESAEFNDGAALPKVYRVQMEQQMMVNGAGRALFSAGSINEDGDVTEERHAWYSSDPALRAEIIPGWKQLEADRVTHAPSTPAAPVVANRMESLPAVSVIVSGEIAIKDNFKAFEVALHDFLEHRLIRSPKSDQDFADLDVQIKAMKGAEAALDSAEAGWIAQIDAVGAAKRNKDMLHKLVRDNRLMAEKLLASEKDRRKAEIVAGGADALRKHFDTLNTRLGKPYMPAALAQADFGGAMRNLRSLASMEDAVSTLLAKSKIAANEVADRIALNLATLREKAAAHAFLFADTAQLVLKQVDDLAAIVTARIGEHETAKAEEKRKAEEETQRRIREAADAAEAKAKKDAEDAAAEAARAAQAKAAEHRRMLLSELEGVRQQVMIARVGRQGVRAGGTLQCMVDTLEETKRWKFAAEYWGDMLQVAESTKADAVFAIEAMVAEATKPAPTPATPAPAQAPAVVQLTPRAAPAAPAPLAQATLKLGDIAKRLGFSLSAEFLKGLGFEPAGKVGAHGVYHETDFPDMLAALVRHIETVSAQQAA